MSVSDFEVYHELRDACRVVLEQHGVNHEHVKFRLLISGSETRNALIRRDYSLMPQTAASREFIAQRYGLSESRVKQIVYQE